MSPHEKWAEDVVNDPYALRGVLLRAHNTDRASEAIQEAVTRFLDRKASGDNETVKAIEEYKHFRGWIITVASNYLISEARARARNRHLQSHQDEAALPASTEETDSAERQELVRQAMDALPPEVQKLLRQKVLDCRGYEELASEMGCSTTTAWKRVQRSLDGLRAWLLAANHDLFAWLPIPKQKKRRTSHGGRAGKGGRS